MEILKKYPNMHPVNICLKKVISNLLVYINSVTVEKGIPFRAKCVGRRGEEEAHCVPGVGWGGDAWSQDS